MTVADSMGPLSDPSTQFLTTLEDEVQEGWEYTLQRAKYCLFKNSLLWSAEAEVSKQRVAKLQDLLRKLSTVLTDLSTLAIKMTETLEAKELTTKAAEANINLGELNKNLENLWNTYVQVLSDPQFDPPLISSNPDLATFRQGEGSGPPNLNVTNGSGSNISKLTKTLQSEVDNLNKTFNLEFSEASHKLSMQNNAVVMLKEFVDKLHQVTLKCLGA